MRLGAARDVVLGRRGVEPGELLALEVPAATAPTAPQRSTALRGWFDGKDDAKNDDWKDEMMREQKEILSRRQDKDKTRDYFKKVDEKRVQAQKEQVDRWAFQRDPTADPLIAWKKMRKEGKIGDLKTGLGVDGEKREGGIPLPLPSFGVGGEAGVGGQYDNGERFDLRLPYADQGYVDEDADFMGKLMGMSIRTKLLLPFEFPPLIWKALVGEVVKPVDLSAIDAVTCSFLTALRNCEEDGVTDHESFEAKYNQELDFTYTGSDGVQRPLRTPGLDRSLSTGSPRIVTFENRLEYCAAVERARIHEFDAQVARIADGLGKVVPMDALQLFSWQQLEVLVAGSSTFDIDLWKKNTSSTGVSSRNLAWFWKVIESLSSKDQSAFIRFAWGRSRLPNAKHFSTKMKLPFSITAPHSAQGADALLLM